MCVCVCVCVCVWLELHEHRSTLSPLIINLHGSHIHHHTSPLLTHTPPHISRLTHTCTPPHISTAHTYTTTHLHGSHIHHHTFPLLTHTPPHISTTPPHTDTCTHVHQASTIHVRTQLVIMVCYCVAGWAINRTMQCVKAQMKMIVIHY